MAIAGAVFCHFWGWIVLGREQAARCRIVGLFALLLGAVLVVVIAAVGSQPLGDQIAFRAALGVAGMVVGGALDFAMPGRRFAGTSAAPGIGLTLWGITMGALLRRNRLDSAVMA